MQPDICSRKSHDNGGSPEAFTVAQESAATIRQRVVDLIRQRGTLTLDEACSLIAHPKHSLSARLAEAQRDGLIERMPEKRKNAIGISVSVYRLRSLTDDQGQHVLFGGGA
jgi:predicted transcriptional regulator